MAFKKKNVVKISTLLAAGCVVGGDFCAPGSARVDGEIKGNVSIEGVLVLGSAGIVRGDVCADAVQIGGEVYGNITAPERAELTETAKVIGDIKTKVIVIDENAVFQGKIEMEQAQPEEARKAPAEANGLEKPEPVSNEKEDKAEEDKVSEDKEAQEKEDVDKEDADKEDEDKEDEDKEDAPDTSRSPRHKRKLKGKNKAKCSAAEAVAQAIKEVKEEEALEAAEEAQQEA